MRQTFELLRRVADSRGSVVLQGETGTGKKLLALEGRQVRRVGGDGWTDCDVRVVCATTPDLHDDVVTGRFREDLFLRLAVVRVLVPPLRDQREDIPVVSGNRSPQAPSS